MKNIEIKIEKRIYNRPEIVCVDLDNAISLALESTPPVGPDEGCLKNQNEFNNNPFRTNLG